MSITPPQLGHARRLVFGVAGALVCLLTGLGAGPAGAAAFPAATWRLHAVWSTVTTHPARHGHKQGSLAVIVSVIGLGVIVVLIVLLGSLSARRRSRPTAPDRRWPDRGPGRGGGGLLG